MDPTIIAAIVAALGTIIVALIGLMRKSSSSTRSPSESQPLRTQGDDSLAEVRSGPSATAEPKEVERSVKDLMSHSDQPAWEVLADAFELQIGKLWTTPDARVRVSAVEIDKTGGWLKIVGEYLTVNPKGLERPQASIISRRSEFLAGTEEWRAEVGYQWLVDFPDKQFRITVMGVSPKQIDNNQRDKRATFKRGEDTVRG